MGHNISEVTLKFGSSYTTISRVYREYQESADGRVLVWRNSQEFMGNTCQQGTVQAGIGSVMVWGVSFLRDMDP
ncbi:hypothetical protein TNCV_1289181 [Trichonephila clavipes]|nr:hypothetical protein TNCV_1289181 [Trichonephila clavipes]